jgi:hypothetical protein
MKICWFINYTELVRIVCTTHTEYLLPERGRGRGDRMGRRKVDGEVKGGEGRGGEGSMGWV